MPRDRFVYLDHAASSPERVESVKAREAYRKLRCSGANPNSLHTLGREAARVLDSSRGAIAAALGGGFRPSDVVFTSGGTESNGLALFGMAEGARARDSRRFKVVISAIEHDSEIDVIAPLRDRGFDVDLVRPGRDGAIDPDEVASLVGPQTALVSVMSANNETGVMQPVDKIAHVAHEAGALMHTDAIQGFCKVPLELSDVDAVSVAAHKIGGPVGIGALAVRSRCPIRPQSFGGGQEGGRRSGTQDVEAAVSFAAAAKACCASLEETRALVSARATRLYARLCAPGTRIVPTTDYGDASRRLPGMVSVMVPGLESETLILRLDSLGFEVSAGSACSSGSLDPSHVLMAMGIPRDDAFGSLRISFDERTSESDLDSFAEALLGVSADLLGSGKGRHQA